MVHGFVEARLNIFCMKVLIVEDNKEVAEYLKSRLTEEGFVLRRRE
jgi:hypothetical protein